MGVSNVHQGVIRHCPQTSHSISSDSSMRCKLPSSAGKNRLGCNWTVWAVNWTVEIRLPHHCRYHLFAFSEAGSISQEKAENGPIVSAFLSVYKLWPQPPIQSFSTSVFLQCRARAVLHRRACGRTALLQNRTPRAFHWPACIHGTTCPNSSSSSWFSILPRWHRYTHHKRGVQCVVSRTNCRPYLDPNCFASALSFIATTSPTMLQPTAPPRMKLIWN